ncbi:MAG: hypothetical protein ACRDHY_13975, partial [Anaerolineales bacterium]
GTPFGRWRWANDLTAALLLVAAIWIVSRGHPRRMFSRPRLLLWAWLAAVCLGPLAFDVLRHTTTTNIPRFALPALPAALLLFSLLMSQLALQGSSGGTWGGAGRVGAGNSDLCLERASPVEAVHRGARAGTRPSAERTANRW